MIFIILRNGELYHGNSNKKPNSVKAYTTRGTAEGVIKREASLIATQKCFKYDDIYPKLLLEVLNSFSIKEVEI